MCLHTDLRNNCLYCGTVLVGRSDKKFCDDSCRNNYHYRKKDEDADASMIKKVNAALLSNREILKSICAGQKKVVKRKVLDDRRFDYELMTALYRTRTGTEYRVIYDYAYKILDDDDVQLLRFVKPSETL